MDDQTPGPAARADASSTAEPFVLGGSSIAPGDRQVVALPVSTLSNGVPADLAVMVIHGRKPGPVMFVSACVHGDEIIGVEIIRRLAARPSLRRLYGTLLLVPVVNGYGFLNRSRYLPDRRDLNRSFPGSPSGSLAARLAHVFLNQVVARCALGVDIHSAAVERENLPQLRISDRGDDDTPMQLAEAFAPPVVVRSALRESSLRQSAEQLGVPVLLFEGGEGLRFHETAVRAGLAGILRVMSHMGMIHSKRIAAPKSPSFVAHRSLWVRSPNGGLLRLFKGLGDAVEDGERIGVIGDLFGSVEHDLIAPKAGVIIGRTNLPVVNEGDALVHVAVATKLGRAMERVGTLVDQLGEEEMFYEDEIF